MIVPHDGNEQRLIKGLPGSRHRNQWFITTYKEISMSRPMFKLSAPFLMLATLLTQSALANQTPSASVSAFKSTWTAKALKLQREIDLNAPLREASFLGTHNSYNSKSYQTPVRYIDPNQNLSLYEQLETGVRSIELDAHWTLSSKFRKDILLCHGQPNHLGCGLFDREFVEGLQEIKDWLKANPGELVLLYIERHLDGHEPRLADELEKYLGEFIYHPSQVRKPGDERNSCVALPTSISKADVLKSGKQLIVVVKGCDGTNPDYEEKDKFHYSWNDTVFAGIGNIPGSPYDWVEQMIGDFTHYPDCGKSSNSDVNHSSLWRVYEDRTLITDIIHPQKKLYAEDMKELVYCGINWPTMDMLDAGDDRLSAAIWSWAPEYPQEGKGECAVYRMGSGIENTACDTPSEGYVCQEETSHNLKAVAAAGPWLAGESMCQSLAGKEWHFAVPVNGRQMNTVRDMLNNLSLNQAWLNYREKSSGAWVANLRN